MYLLILSNWKSKYTLRKKEDKSRCDHVNSVVFFPLKNKCHFLLSSFCGTIHDRFMIFVLLSYLNLLGDVDICHVNVHKNQSFLKCSNFSFCKLESVWSTWYLLNSWFLLEYRSVLSPPLNKMSSVMETQTQNQNTALSEMTLDMLLQFSKLSELIA